jgi:hypothetical protein
VSRRDHNPFEQPPDPAPEFTEWQKHMYDRGYYLGGRIPPYLRRRRGRKNPYGSWLIFSAITIVFVGPAIDEIDGGTVWMKLVYAGISFFLLVAGVRLLKGDSGPAKRPKS